MRPMPKRAVPTRKPAARKARRRKTAPQARAAKTGPQNCLRLHGCVPSIAAVVAGACRTCATVPDVLHVPLRVAGAFCPGCCPTCRSAAEVTAKAAKRGRTRGKRKAARR